MSNDKLKIAIVFDDSLDRDDGVQQYIKLIGSYFVRQGHHVDYLVGESRQKPGFEARVFSLSKNITVKGNQNLLSIPLPANRSKIKRILNQNQYDVIHVQMPFNPLLAGRVIRYAPKSSKIIGTFHIVGSTPIENLGSHLLSVLQRRSLKRIDKVISVSEAAQAYSKKYFRLNSEIIPNAVDLSKFMSAKPISQLKGDKQTILFLGRLVRRKGAEYLLRAVAKLNTENKMNNRQLIICGKGPLEQDLHKLASQLGVDNMINFAGYIPEQDKPNYLATADIAVFPATGGESFGIVLIESMAAGTLTVAGNNPGYKTVLKPWPQCIFDPKDINKLAEIIDGFLSDPVTANSIAMSQQQNAKEYDINNVGRRLLDCYINTLSELE